MNQTPEQPHLDFLNLTYQNNNIILVVYSLCTELSPHETTFYAKGKVSSLSGR